MRVFLTCRILTYRHCLRKCDLFTDETLRKRKQVGGIIVLSNCRFDLAGAIPAVNALILRRAKSSCLGLVRSSGKSVEKVPKYRVVYGIELGRESCET